MGIRETTAQAKDVIMSCLNELLSDELMNGTGSSHPDSHPELIVALQKQVARVQMTLFYKES